MFCLGFSFLRLWYALREDVSRNFYFKRDPCLGGNVCPARTRCATFVLSILSLAPSLSPPGEVPQVDRTRLQTFRTKHIAYENSTTQNVTPTTSNHCEKVLQIVW